MSAQTQTRKKQIETRYFEEARLANEAFPRGELVPHEKPDFLLRMDKGTIGIEVTELCREEPRAESGRLAKVPEKAKACYDRLAESEPIDVSLAFSRHAATLTLEQLTKPLVELGPGEVCARPNDLSEWKFSFDFEKVLLFAREPGGGGEVFELQRM